MRRLLLTLALIASPLTADEIEIATEDSIFAVITHKGGIASGVAHNHLITAADYQAKLSFQADAPLETRFELKLASEKLAVDPWDLEQAWYPRFEALGLLDEPFTEVSDKDRAKIRKSMLSKGQLNSSAHPELMARVVEIKEESVTYGAETFPYTATLELEIRGQKVRKPVAARYAVSHRQLTIEAVGAFLFTDFDIKPYSALLGAIKNLDEIHVYLNLKASLPEPKEVTAPTTR